MIIKFFSKKKSNENRTLWIDFLKILAAFLVIFYHIAFYRLDYGFSMDRLYYFPNMNRILMCFCSCSVPLFFMVNGTLMLKKNRNWKDVYCKAAKIGSLYIVWSIMKFPGWFFRTLFILYLMFPMFQFLKNKYKKIYYAICGCVFIMPFLHNFLLLFIKIIGIKEIAKIPIDKLNVTGMFTMYSILYFLIGGIIKEKNVSKIIGIILSVAGWALVVFECTVYTNINHKMYDGVNSAFPTIGALLLALGMYIIVSYCSFERARSIIVKLGNAVLPVYLLHMGVINCFDYFFDIHNLRLVTAILLSIMIYILCAVIGDFAKRVPILDWFFEI